MGQTWNNLRFNCASVIDDWGTKSTVIALAAAAVLSAVVLKPQNYFGKDRPRGPMHSPVQAHNNQYSFQHNNRHNNQYARELDASYNSAISSLERRKASIIHSAGAKSSFGGIVNSACNAGISINRARTNDRRRRSSSRKRFDHRNWGKAVDHGTDALDVYCTVPQINAEIDSLTRRYSGVVADGVVTRKEAMRLKPAFDRAIAKSGSYRKSGRRGIW